ncbi:DUF1983 domain-containing protein, partial [Pseudomonas sp.]|uniref:DUF1983 domain-containing protein n=2 Tax=unclassified Pseudomonas TaxID=196821 RepID=UPI00289B26F7
GAGTVWYATDWHMEDVSAAKAAQATADANAAATSALGARVALTETGLTSASHQITDLTNTLGEVGGENLFFNPSFDRPLASDPRLADGWNTNAFSVTATPSLVTSSLDTSGKAQRIELTSLTAGSAVDFGVRTIALRPKVSSAQVIGASIYARGSAGLTLQIYIQARDSADASLASYGPYSINLGTAWKRASLLSLPLPEGTTQTNTFFRIQRSPGSALTAGFVEMDRAQLEIGTVVSGWRDNGQVNAAMTSQVSSAVESLNSTVSQQGATLTSVTNRTTALENSVNSPSNGLATKASTSALETLSGRVTATEQGLTSQATSLTGLTASIKAANSAGGNVVPNATFDPAYSRMGFTAVATSGTSVPPGCPLKYAAQLTSRDHYPLLADVPFVAVKPGDVWRLSALVACGAGTAPFNLYVQIGTDPNTVSRTGTGGGRVTTTSTWTRTTWDYTVPAGVFFIRPFLQIEQTAGAGTVWYATDWHMEDVSAAKAAQATADATAAALSSTQATVTQQGDRLTAEGQRIDGLYASVGDANAAIQTEATARSDGDTALGRRVDTVQSNLGTTNASVQQISTAQTALNGKVNATWSVKLGLTSGGTYYAAGFGLGLENQGGTFQSSFVVLANRFAIMNPVGEGLIVPFAVQNGQVFINDALISNLAVQKAIVGNSINSSALANDGTPIMRVDFASGTIIMLNQAANAYTVFNRNGIDMVINGVRRIRMGEW